MDDATQQTAPFSMTRRIQFAETDMAGVLHFSNYFRLMEEVEHAFWRSLDISVYTPHDERGDGTNAGRTISWPRVAVACEYYSPARFEDELDLLFRIVHIGRRSIEFETEFFKGGDRIALGKITAVCCETTGGTFAPIEIPASMRGRLVERISGRALRD